MTARLRILKSVLGGDLFGATLTCPTVGHTRKDRGTSITDRSGAPGDLLVHVHNGTPGDALMMKDRALEILGEEPAHIRRRQNRDDPIVRMQLRAARRAAEERERVDALTRQRRAVSLWNESQDPTETVVETYLRSRGLDLPSEIAGSVLRFHPRCPFGPGTRALAMVAAMRCVRSGEIKAVHRTALTPAGRKIDRKMLGPVAETAVMLDPEEVITSGIAIGEGIETCLAARQLGIRPAWALGSTSNIKSFPVLPGIEALTLLVENDEHGASETACRSAGTRWHRAGRAVDVVRPRTGKDLNDTIWEGAAA